MKVWTTVIGQRLDGAENTRSMLLCAELLRRGHNVVMWTSAYDHIRKEWRKEWLGLEDRGGAYVRNDGLEIRFMRGCGYKRNLSPRRLIDHWLAARSFRKQAAALPPPDIIVASLPDHLTAAAAVAFGKQKGIATVIDVRDKWPDIFVDHMANPILRVLVRAILVVESARSRVALSNATALVAMMESMMTWALAKANRSRSSMERVFFLTTSPRNFGVEPRQLGVESAVTRLLPTLAGRIVLTFVGTFNKTQHPTLILDALEILRSRSRSRIAPSRFAVVIGGDGLDAQAVLERSRRFENVYYAGWLTNDEMALLLSHSHVGLLAMNFPSPAFNNKSFAYLASGLPIINGATGDLADIIESERAGINVEGGNATALANAMEKLITDDALRIEMTDHVRKLFLQRFDRESNYRSYVDHIEEIARSANKR